MRGQGCGTPRWACAALLTPVVEVDVGSLRARQSDSPALARYDEAAQLLTGHPDASIDDGLDWIRHTVELLDMPSLEVFGLRPHHADEIVAKAAKASSMQGNPIALTNDELHAILAN